MKDKSTNSIQANGTIVANTEKPSQDATDKPTKGSHGYKGQKTAFASTLLKTRPDDFSTLCVTLESTFIIRQL